MIIDKSYGRAKYGRVVFFVRPEIECFNRSHRIVCTSKEDFENKLQSIKKKIEPEILFLVDECIIVANSEKNAMQEYWRVCEKERIGLPAKSISRIEHHD